MKFRELLWRSSLIWLRFGFAGGVLMALCALPWFGVVGSFDLLFAGSHERDVWRRVFGATYLVGGGGAVLYAYIGLISGLAHDPDGVLERSVGKGFGRAFPASALFLGVTTFNFIVVGKFFKSSAWVETISNIVRPEMTFWGAAVIGWIVGAVSGGLGVARQEIERQRREMREISSERNLL